MNFVISANIPDTDYEGKFFGLIYTSIGNNCES